MSPAAFSPARRRALTRPTAAWRRLLGRVGHFFAEEKVTRVRAGEARELKSEAAGFGDTGVWGQVGPNSNRRGYPAIISAAFPRTRSISAWGARATCQPIFPAETMMTSWSRAETWNTVG